MRTTCEHCGGRIPHRPNYSHAEREAQRFCGVRCHREASYQPPDTSGRTRAAQAPHIDPLAVERAVMGRPPEHLSYAERAEAVRRLAHLSIAETARRVGCTPRTVQRIRAWLREASAA